MMTAQSRYIFCDIDGTLLHARGSGRIAFRAAIEEAYGVAINLDHINFAGATDTGVVERLLSENGLVSDPVKNTRLFESLAFHLDRNMTEVPPTVFAGVVEFLERVSLHWKLALVSGNIRTCAFLKLKHAGIDRFFTEIGGFGDDHADRNRMAALALERAGHPSGAYLLGDTPADIEAARTNGITSVAVCNGQFSRADLEAECPDIIVDSFEDAEHLFRVLEA